MAEREFSKRTSKFRVSSFVVPGGGIRHMLMSHASGLPPKAASLYEAHLVQKTDSHNTRSRELAHLASLYSWAKHADVDLDELLLTGQGLTLPQIRSFAAWLRTPLLQGNGIIPQKKRHSFNLDLTTCAAICGWFITEFLEIGGSPMRRAVELERFAASQNRSWKAVRIKVRKQSTAPDMAEAEIAAVEAYLRPEARSKSVGTNIAVRDYLMWRMAIEFGMRKGEILAMRTIDCPTRSAPYFRIVRIEERGPEYVDPRKNPPRPKTLSRDLGFIISATKFPRLVGEYVSAHRFRVVKRLGRKMKQFLLPHDFLIITKDGEPLSIRAADDVAKAITAGTGVKFHWHLARHAFFNRAYAAVTEVQDRNDYDVKLADLVHWGGWTSAQSLEIYTKRARADRARHSLRTWQTQGNQWTALT